MLRTTCRGIVTLLGLVTANCAGGQSFDDGSNPVEQADDDTTPADDDATSGAEDAGAAGGPAGMINDASAGGETNRGGPNGSAPSSGGGAGPGGAGPGSGGSTNSGGTSASVGGAQPNTNAAGGDEGVAGAVSMAGAGGAANAGGAAGAGGSASAGASSGAGGSAAAGGAASNGDGSGQWLWQSRAASATRNGLAALWTDAANDVWAAGGSGTMLHFDGNSWSAVDAATQSNVSALWGSGPADIWAVAGGFGGAGAANLVHFDGNAWSVVDPGTTANLTGIWGSAADDVWVTGRFDGVLHFDGNAWSLWQNGPAGMEGLVAGSGPDDVWVARSGSVFSHDTGNGQWQPVAGDGVQSVTGLWVNAPNDAWTANYLEIQHWDGASWSVFVDPTLTGANAIWGSASDQVTAVGSDATIDEWDGVGWSNAVSGGADLRAVGGSEQSNRWAVGDSATVFHFESGASGSVTCDRIGGSCTAAAECAPGAGHVSDFACDGDASAVCCVDPNACGGGEPECCDADGGRSRPICHNGAFLCTAGSEPCPLTP
jgi:hypothetical protein